MPNTKRRLSFSGNGASHIGMKRTTNEDRYLVDNENYIYAVADGIGGLPLGEKASECSIRVLRRVIADETSGVKTHPSEIIKSIHQAVRQISSLVSPQIGMGTTFTYVRTLEDSCEIGHVGDSAAFLITSNSIARITIDHVTTAPQVKVTAQNGLDTAKTHIFERKTLSRFIGQPDPLEPGVFHLQPNIGDRVLICSDGICGPISEDEIYRISKAQPKPEGFANALIQTANNRCAFDNATAVVICCNEP